MSTAASRRNPLAVANDGWNRFWFAPTDPATLSAIRLFAGAMLFYTHIVWTLDLEAFFGPNGWLPLELMDQAHAGRPFAWTYFAWIDSPGLLWTVHIVALVVFLMFTIGLFSRIVAPLAFIAAIAYAHRISPGASFGLDKINCLLALYLMLGPCGARYSLDRLRARRHGEEEVAPSSAANVAIRLIQIHMCVLYLFSGVSKLQGVTWWDGSAFWWGVAISEYQTLDMTWLAHTPWLFAAITYGTLLWETFYCVLIWNRYTRVLCLTIALFVHGGIALAMGMITFGLAMLIGNLAFISPRTVRRVFERHKG